MLCSDCSEPVRPVVSTDTDGTLGDYHRHFMKFASMYLGYKERNTIQPEGHDGTTSFRYWSCKNLKVDESAWRDIKLAYRQGAQKRSHARSFMGDWPDHEVTAAGAEPWPCTTRPYLRLDGIDPDTRFWLSNNGIES